MFRVVDGQIVEDNPVIKTDRKTLFELAFEIGRAFFPEDATLRADLTATVVLKMQDKFNGLP